MNEFQLLQLLGGMTKSAADPVTAANAAAASNSDATASKSALQGVKDFFTSAGDMLNNSDSKLNKAIRGEYFSDNNLLRRMFQALPEKGKSGKGLAGLPRRLGASLRKAPGRWGAIAAAGTGLAGLGTAILGGSDSSFDIPKFDEIPDEWKPALWAGAGALPVLGAAVGGLTGDGMMRGAAKGLGAVGGGYLGYQGGKYLANYLDKSDFGNSLGDNGKNALRLASILGGTALGGIGGSSIAGSLVPGK